MILKITVTLPLLSVALRIKSSLCHNVSICHKSLNVSNEVKSF